MNNFTLKSLKSAFSGGSGRKKAGTTDGKEAGTTDGKEAGTTVGKEAGATSRKEAGATSRKEAGATSPRSSTGSEDSGTADKEKSGGTDKAQSGGTDGEESGSSDGEQSGSSVYTTNMEIDNDDDMDIDDDDIPEQTSLPSARKLLRLDSQTASGEMSGKDDHLPDVYLDDKEPEFIYIPVHKRLAQDYPERYNRLRRCLVMREESDDLFKRGVIDLTGEDVGVADDGNESEEIHVSDADDGNESEENQLVTTYPKVSPHRPGTSAPDATAVTPVWTSPYFTRSKATPVTPTKLSSAVLTRRKTISDFSSRSAPVASGFKRQRIEIEQTDSSSEADEQSGAQSSASESEKQVVNIDELYPPNRRLTTDTIVLQKHLAAYREQKKIDEGHIKNIATAFTGFAEKHEGAFTEIPLISLESSSELLPGYHTELGKIYYEQYQRALNDKEETTPNPGHVPAVDMGSRANGDTPERRFLAGYYNLSMCAMYHAVLVELYPQMDDENPMPIEFVSSTDGSDSNDSDSKCKIIATPLSNRRISKQKKTKVLNRLREIMRRKSIYKEGTTNAKKDEKEFNEYISDANTRAHKYLLMALVARFQTLDFMLVPYGERNLKVPLESFAVFQKHLKTAGDYFNFTMGKGNRDGFTARYLAKLADHIDGKRDYMNMLDDYPKAEKFIDNFIVYMCGDE
ncbi:hypothetical protein GGI05_001758 [Coemansia sp. RSA 2603]|nr:hypothetical protein GGI05_001758 [Coemansia sp. RSA 2603]